MSATLQEFFDTLPERIDTAKLAGINALFQFVGTDEGGGEWFVRIADGVPEVGTGHVDNADLTATAQTSIFLDIVNGRLRGEMAFLTGRLKVEGDITLALKIESLLHT